MKVTHYANPLAVSAQVITHVGLPDGLGCRIIKTEDGREMLIAANMTPLFDPSAGDYFVIQEDGRESLLPKAVFERRYSPLHYTDKQ